MRLGDFLNANAYSHPDSPYSGPTINLRSCFGGQLAEQFANWSGLRTTGWTGTVGIGSPGGCSTGNNDKTPNYHGHGWYVTYTPIKGMGNGATRTGHTNYYTGY